MTERETTPAARATRVAVIGPGAIGTTIAAALHEAGRTPALYGRTPRPGLELVAAEERLPVPGPVRADPAEVSHPADVVFLAVKATQIAGAAPWLAVLCGPDTVVCILQNGVEQVSMVSPHLPPGTAILPSVVWFPAQAQEDGSVRLRGEARLSLPETRGSDRIVEVLRGTRCEIEVVADFSTVAWRKLLQNAAAGLMALTGRRSGMFARDDIADLTRAYLQEGLLVARAEGARLADDAPDEILAKFRAFPADLSTSILTDRDAGRPLEWDVRNGVISRLGRAHGIPTPIADVIATLLAATSDGPG
ncbi:2-dehydropantoate 2-reductase [Microbacterium sp. Y-01]|uniref:oxidoreductase n=1 Tax=Microbacterium sp. Y-01 TaxID=2048898 RepID=UPI000F5E897E|nr:oxidoreductase [Microbacterium sp. Y-01]AZH78951.1 2-dehydropantoate 2-reductase [Microbacterium sp. Y-01]